MRFYKPLPALLLSLALLFALLPAPAQAAQSNEMAVYTFLRTELKLNDAAACGVMANIQCESGFDPNAVGDHGTSYGICQWHNSRWTALKQYRPRDWNTLTGQLEFLRYELIHSKPAVWRYITAVGNSAEGAYLAGHYWCYHFEIPKNFPTVSIRRGNLAKNTYWPRYAGKSVSDGEPPAIVGASCPQSMTQGGRIELYGDVYSDLPVTTVTVSLLDAQGRDTGEGTETSPGSNTYSLHSLGRYIGFPRLLPGSYTLRITAANAAGETSWTQSLNVRPAADGPEEQGNLEDLLRRIIPAAATSEGQAKLAVNVMKAVEKLAAKS